MLNFKESFDKHHKAKAAAAKMEIEKNSFKLADLGWITTVAELAVLGICAIENWRLFKGAAPGVLGWVTGTMALVMETLAFMCFQNIEKAAGRHRKALMWCAFILTGTAICHALIEYWKTTEVLQSTAPQIQFYAQYLALAVLLVEVIAAAFVLRATHWKSEINQSRALAHETMAKSRAQLITEKSLMDDEQALDDARLEHVERQLVTQQRYVEKIKDVANVHTQAEAALSSIQNEQLQNNLRATFGQIAQIGLGGRANGAGGKSQPPKP